MDQQIIDAVKATGLKVYMRKPNDTWLYYTDGIRIGYLQNSGFEGITLSTVHVPNKTTGSGFRLSLNDVYFGSVLDFDTLATAFCSAPPWANSRDRESVRKWRDIGHFMDSCVFNSEYREV